MSETKYQIIEDCPDFMHGCCQKYLDGDCSAHKCDLKIIRELQQKLQEKEQEIKLAKEMLIQNDYETNKNTLPQIIEEFMSNNLLDMQDDEGYTIPVFIQVENKLETLEDLEQECEELKRGIVKQCPICGEQFLSHIGAELFEENAKLKQELEMRKANEQESDEFWNEVFDKDYPFNKENAYKELADYYFFLQQIPKIYYEITGETLSKTNYFASAVILAYRDNCERCQEKQEQEIKNFEKQLQEENKALKSENFTFEELIKTQEELIDNYKHTLDEIEKKCLKYQTCRIILKEDVLDIINKAKES